MADPDAPEHQLGQYWIHWIVSNVHVSVNPKIVFLTPNITYLMY